MYICYRSGLAVADKGIAPAFGPDGRLAAMARIYSKIVRQYHQPGLDAINKLSMTAPRHQRRADTSIEEGVPGKNPVPGKQANTSGRMTRCVYHRKTGASHLYNVSLMQQPVRGSRCFIGNPEHGAKRPPAFEEIGIFDVDGNIGSGPGLNIEQRGNMVGVTVGEYYCLNNEFRIGNGF